MSDCCCPSTDKGEINKDCCFVCGGKIVYFQEPKEFACGSCGRVEQGYVACEKGHYICDTCHKAGAFDVIKEMALVARSKDPFATAEAMMDSPAIPMTGCEHAFITAGAFMSALRSEGSLNVTDAQVIDAMRRADTISKAAYCGLAGTCGIASGLAASFSVILGSSCDKDREYSMTFMAMARATEAIAAEGGPCCDKDFVRTALTVGCQMAKEYFNVKLPMHKEKIVCHHFKRGNHCHGGRCAYFPKTKEEAQAAKGISLKLKAAPVSPGNGCCEGK